MEEDQRKARTYEKFNRKNQVINSKVEGEIIKIGDQNISIYLFPWKLFIKLLIILIAVAILLFFLWLFFDTPKFVNTEVELKGHQNQTVLEVTVRHQSFLFTDQWLELADWPVLFWMKRRAIKFYPASSLFSIDRAVFQIQIPVQESPIPIRIFKGRKLIHQEYYHF
jgi:hypothetical protein